MERVLVIPAAGRGARLGSDLPKALVPVAGKPMLRHLLDLYAPVAQRVVVIVSPSARSQVAAALGERADLRLVVQDEPTGMLDAILLSGEAVREAAPERVLITWCDQIAMSPQTIAAVVAATRKSPAPALVLPVCRSRDPYVHLQRDAGRTIRAVLHRREGDAMPAEGESDAGVFDLSYDTFMRDLAQYADAPAIGARTGERNFVPFVAWVAARAPVVTVPCAAPIEAVGINTPEELQTVETHLRGQQGP